MADDKKYEILARETLFQGYFRLDRYHLQYERFDGSWGEPISREIYSYGHKVAGVLLFDPRQDKVVMVEQFRTGPAAHGIYPWLLEIVMGMIDGVETPEQAARREAVEEAGCEIIDMQMIGSYFTSPGGTADHVTLFVGRTNAPEDGGNGGIVAEGEDIRVHVMDATKAIGLLFADKIRDAQTMIALQWFAMHRTELRSRWLVSDVGTPII